MINAFILSAGFGERLRPITNHIPKPLLPIIGKSILEVILDRINNLSPSNIFINLHYKSELIKRHIEFIEFQYKDKIGFFYEEPILGTGGALKNAKDRLKEGTFLVHNSDVISKIDLKSFLNLHKKSKNIATLAVHNNPKFNNLIINDEGFLRGVSTKVCPSNKAFTGIAIYEPEFLEFLPDGQSSVVDGWIKALMAGKKIGTIDFTNVYWADIGTPSSYASAVFDSLVFDGERVYIHPSAKGCSKVDLNGLIVINKGVNLSKDSYLRNCIILPDCNVPLGRYENCIIGDSFRIDLEEVEILGGSDKKIPLRIGGSDRRFFRIFSEDISKRLCPFESPFAIGGGKNKVFAGFLISVEYKKADQDFQRHLEYTRFFKKHKIPVPDLLDIDHKNKILIFEDLGDITLYSWLKCERSQQDILKIYQKTIYLATLIHKIDLVHLADCSLLKERVFDYRHFRWESDYFIERYLIALKGFKEKDISFILNELDTLAHKADLYPKTIIHRDFQSQNIMIKDQSPRIVDYQGARIGPPSYDIASLLWDPYYRLDDTIRKKVLDYYIETMGDALNKNLFLESLSVCRIQRHMQALGAYGFLSKEKGKRYFLKFIPECLRLLKEDIALLNEEFPALYGFINRLNP
jgi:NDP-sugar pyrophosphorylase family protein/aminoglycoside/choline kinase family phosphotransferase